MIAVLGLSLSPALAAQKTGPVAALPAPHANSGQVHLHHYATTANRESHPVLRKSNIAGTTTSNSATAGSSTRLAAVGSDSTLNTEDLTGGAPGLGFDYEYLAATSGNLAVEALINPVTQAELALAARTRRNGIGSSAYILGGYGYYPAEYDSAQAEPQAAADPPAASPQPQVFIIQQPSRRNEASADPSLGDDPAPQAEPTSPMTLVLKNGSHIDAVAFTRQGDKIVYITGNGSRSTLAVADVDAAATTKLNDDRGTPLNLTL
jgi:hypothetical protein